MTDSVQVLCEVLFGEESPCTGVYTILVPECRDSTPLRQVRVTGIALERGTYRVTMERVDGDGVS